MLTVKEGTERLQRLLEQESLYSVSIIQEYIQIVLMSPVKQGMGHLQGLQQQESLYSASIKGKDESMNSRSSHTVGHLSVTVLICLNNKVELLGMFMY